MSITDLLPWKRENKSEIKKREASDPIDAFQRDMNRWFDEFFNPDFGLSRLSDESSWSGFVPSVDVSETDDEITVSADLPGLEKENIELQIQDNVLTIRGEREHHEETKERNVYRSERSYGTFHRSVRLPAEVDANKADAKYKNGVLTVKLPKPATSRQKKIRVNRG